LQLRHPLRLLHAFAVLDIQLKVQQTYFNVLMDKQNNGRGNKWKSEEREERRNGRAK
jgi:hypothetical protein